MTQTPTIPTTSRLLPRHMLAPADVTAMCELLAAHFDGVTEDQFRHDLSEKNWALLIERGDRLVGFTTVLAYETVTPDGPASVIYSGDTIVAPDAWNSSILPRSWIAAVAAIRQHYPRGPLLWLLITSGFRTYRLLPVFWRDFHPRHDAPTPPHVRATLHHLASQRFGPAYDPRAGIVRLPRPQRLRGALAGVPENRRTDPHVAFFLSRNHGHAAGDELVCLTELSPANLTSAGRRMAAAVSPW
jgi:hypothetical protein